MQSTSNLVNLFKILSDETRLRIMVLLFREELCVCQLEGILDVSQPNISKHLSKLRDVGFVKDERKEKFIFYKFEHENKILVNVINNIIDHLDVYPQLCSDKERLANKEIYLSRCKSNLD